MKTMTVRDIRLHWPDAEKALANEGEIIVTRDSKPVAKIVPYTLTETSKRPRFEPAEQMRWLRKISKGEAKQPSTLSNHPKPAMSYHFKTGH